MILCLDNRDSFVFNLVQILREAGTEVLVLRSDRCSAREVLARRPKALLLSPGPGAPGEMGCLLDLAECLPPDLPVLGVCLGHQALASATGLPLRSSLEIVHGRTSAVHHRGRGLFAGLPTPLELARYHSIEVDAADLEGSPWILEAWIRTGDRRIVMAMRHSRRPWFGWQFHPESFLSPAGPRLLRRFLRLALHPEKEAAAT